MNEAAIGTLTILTGDYKCSCCCECDWCVQWDCLLLCTCVCVWATSMFISTMACVPAAGRLCVRHSQQHDACGGAHPVDGAERGQGVHTHRPVCGAHRGPCADWRQSGHFKGTAASLLAALTVTLSKGRGLAKCPIAALFSRILE